MKQIKINKNKLAIKVTRLRKDTKICYAGSDYETNSLSKENYVTLLKTTSFVLFYAEILCFAFSDAVKKYQCC